MSITSTTAATDEDPARPISATETDAGTPPVRADTGTSVGAQSALPLPPVNPPAQNPLTREDADPTRRRTTQPQVSVVIPTCNEARNLPRLLARIPRDVHEVIIVDGHSVDDTVAVARFLRPDIKVVLQNRFGKGNAVACGFAEVTGDVVVTLDADGSTDPMEIPRLVAALLDGADFAKGSRFTNSGDDRAVTASRGYRCLNWLANVLFHARYTDLCYGYHAFWRDCLSHLALDPGPRESVRPVWGDGFETEPVMNARAAKARLRIAEVSTIPSDRIPFGLAWRDSARVLRALVVERLNGVARAPRWVGRPARSISLESPAPRDGGETGS